jgi:hypothetical protein
MVFFTGCSSLRPLFEDEVKKEIAKYADTPSGVITEEDVAGLPEPLQKYFRRCNFIGRPKMWNGRIDWREANIKRSQEGGWTSLECVQYNFVPEPARLVYLNAAMWGIIPFDGRDKYQDGAGNMFIRVMNMIEVENAVGREMDQSSLVTVLAEAPMIPSYMLQPYIQWRGVDSLTADATLTRNGISVSGRFFFNEIGEYIRFETKDRFHSSGGVHNNYPWFIEVSDYKDFGGFLQPAVITASWITDKGEYQYWKGEIGAITYNVTK